MVVEAAKSQEAIRAEVAEWLEANWDQGRDLMEWRGMLADSGWGVPHWPTEWYGKGVPQSAVRVIGEEFRRVGAAGPAPGMGIWLFGPTLLEHGTDEQKQRWLRPAITGEEIWCQLFSEPGAGSDLAGAQTTAVLDGDEWVVNGQKVWTSGAQNADYGMLVARTDWDQPKHRGLSYLLLPMKQPGVEVRPLKQMNRQSNFNEVFFTDARIPGENVVGPAGSGWQVALTTLMHERAGTAVATGIGAAAPERAQAEMRTAGPIESWKGLADLARKMGKADDPVIRDRIARFYIVQEVTRLNNERARAERKAGRPPGPEGSIGKLARSMISKMRGDLGLAILGAGGTLDEKDAPLDGVVQRALLSSPSSSIAGGTDEVQKNILGERILGLSKEPSDDRELPFREVKQNQQKWMQG